MYNQYRHRRIKRSRAKWPSKRKLLCFAFRKTSELLVHILKRRVLEEVVLSFQTKFPFILDINFQISSKITQKTYKEL